MGPCHMIDGVFAEMRAPMPREPEPVAGHQLTGWLARHRVGTLPRCLRPSGSRVRGAVRPGVTDALRLAQAKPPALVRVMYERSGS
jgi:hypothetical protein